MKTVTMTASLHQLDVGTADESASGAGTKSAAWRGGGAAGHLLAVPVMPPPAALRPHREPASSLSVDKEQRTRARGEKRGKMEEYHYRASSCQITPEMLMC